MVEQTIHDLLAFFYPYGPVLFICIGLTLAYAVYKICWIIDDVRVTRFIKANSGTDEGDTE